MSYDSLLTLYMTYSGACVVQVGPNGRVVGIEHMQELVDMSIASVRKNHSDWLDEGRLSLRRGDGFAGSPADGPFDAIHVGAAAPVLPPKLLEQLGDNGKMVIPIGPEGGPQRLELVTKTQDGRVDRDKVADVAFVPLTSEQSQRSSLRARVF